MKKELKEVQTIVGDEINPEAAPNNTSSEAPTASEVETKDASNPEEKQNTTSN